MRHGNKTTKLSRTSAHRDAMLRNLVSSLIMHGKVRTSKPKAKAARRLAERTVHLAIHGKDTATRRRVFQLLHDKAAVKHLFNEVAGRFKKDSGGYTRIVPFGRVLGDNTETVLMLLAYEVPEKTKKKSTLRFHFTKKKSDKGNKKAGAKAAAAPAPESAPSGDAPAA
ncbi:MAG: 50S ribosomal protein L17 [Planctomycetota bacterium]